MTTKTNYTGVTSLENLLFAYVKTKTQISFAVSAKLISAFVFTTRIVQSLYSLNLKFQAFSHILWLCNPVCNGPGRKPLRQVFLTMRFIFLSTGPSSTTSLRIRFVEMDPVCQPCLKMINIYRRLYTPSG